MDWTIVRVEKVLVQETTPEGFRKELREVVETQEIHEDPPQGYDDLLFDANR